MQRIAKILFGFAVPLAVEAGEVEAQQRHAENTCRRASRETLPAPLHTQQDHTLRRIELRRRAVERGLAARDPVTQVAKAAHVRELRRIRLVRQRAAAVQQLILGGEHAGHVRHRQRAVVEDSLPREALGIGSLEPGEVVDEVIERLRVDLRGATAVRIGPLLSHARDHHAALVGSRRAQREARGQMLELLRHRELGAYEYERAGHLVVVLRDIFDQAHVDRICQIRMEIQQHVDAGHRRRLQMAQELGRVGDGFLRTAEVPIDAPQAFGHRPLEDAPRAAAAGPEASLAGEVQHARFLA